MSKYHKIKEYTFRTIATIIFSIIFAIAIPSCLKAQKQDFSGAKHFYTVYGINEFAYSTQSVLFPKQKTFYKFLFSNLTAQSAIIGKEQFDQTRCNRNKRTGWSWQDFWTGQWANLIFIQVRICINDIKK